MSTTRILTLFGEEIVNEPAKPAAKSRVRSKESSVQEEEDSENENTSSEIITDNNETPASSVSVEKNTLLGTDNDDNTETPISTTMIEVQQSNDAEQTSEDNSITDTDTEEMYSYVLPDNTDEEYNKSIVADSELTTLAVEYDTTVAQYENQFTLSSKDCETDRESPQADITTAQASKPTKPAKKEKNTSEDIIPEDWNGEKKYYTIGEVADFFKVKTSHIRFWTNEFKLKVRTTRKGDRLFTPEQVKELRAIYHLTKERGFTISGAKAKLKTKNNIDVTTVDLKSSLILLKTKLIALRKQLG